MNKGQDIGPTAATTLIYVAEDDQHLLDLVGLLLENEGLGHAKFNNGEAALAAFRHAKPQPKLIISDFAMGEKNLNGVEFLAACKRLNPAVKAFLVSGTVDESMINVDGKPVDWFMPKPFDMNELMRIVRTLLKD